MKSVIFCSSYLATKYFSLLCFALLQLEIFSAKLYMKCSDLIENHTAMLEVYMYLV